MEIISDLSSIDIIELLIGGVGIANVYYCFKRVIKINKICKRTLHIHDHKA